MRPSPLALRHLGIESRVSSVFETLYWLDTIVPLIVLAIGVGWSICKPWAVAPTAPWGRAKPVVNRKYLPA
jgi:hypothetical protein